ncbi:MAG: zinc ribbon domain-containing protein [Proteobacteria bacterium]|nr:zinc ribbon domain-containing protein [Pseudomonadota bacterium]
MPIYEYECKKCGRMAEIWQKFSDPPLSTCKHCSGELHKLISQSTFHLKGTGWYVTDYANKGGSCSASSAGKANKTSEAKAKKTDTKPAPSKDGE